MAEMTITDIAALTAGAILVSLAVIWLAGALPAPRRAQARGLVIPECHFLFQGDTLIDHDAGTLWPEEEDGATDDWSRFHRWLRFRFGGLPDDPHAIASGKTLTFQSDLPDDAARLDLRAGGGMLRATLVEAGPSCATHLHEARRRLMITDAPGAALRIAPQPVWIIDRDGLPIWQNGAAGALLPEDRARMTAALAPLSEIGDMQTRRVSVPAPDSGGPDRWFDVNVSGMAVGHAVYACDVSALVGAETAQRDFVQTLGRSFADLPIGLAVFDHEKSLAMFNPALIDLTGLPVDFLSARPAIMTFFDMLRDAQVMPEPKNYSNWRSQINDMVSVARGGLYQDCWSLVTGQTYRVTGRPHPNGAVAFLFEDITLEVSEARTHRTEMDLRQAVIDNLDAAIAVLSPDHRLMFCNAGFGTLLGIDPDSSPAETRLRDIVTACQARFPQTTLWPTLERKIATGATVSKTITLAQGAGQLDMRHTPLGRGNTMLSLCHRAAQAHERAG